MSLPRSCTLLPDKLTFVSWLSPPRACRFLIWLWDRLRFSKPVHFAMQPKSFIPERNNSRPTQTRKVLFVQEKEEEEKKNGSRPRNFFVESWSRQIYRLHTIPSSFKTSVCMLSMSNSPDLIFNICTVIMPEKKARVWTSTSQTDICVESWSARNRVISISLFLNPAFKAVTVTRVWFCCELCWDF